jgi:hypothetical protein
VQQGVKQIRKQEQSADTRNKDQFMPPLHAVAGFGKSPTHREKRYREHDVERIEHISQSTMPPIRKS